MVDLIDTVQLQEIDDAYVELFDITLPSGTKVYVFDGLDDGSNNIYFPQKTVSGGVYPLKEYFAIPGESVDVTGFQPMVHCRSQDITGIDTDDTLTVGSVTYNITEIQDDGTGVTVLILQD